MFRRALLDISRLLIMSGGVCHRVAFVGKLWTNWNPKDRKALLAGAFTGVEIPRVNCKDNPNRRQTRIFFHIRFFCLRKNFSNLITVHQDVTYSVYYISVGSSTCFGCWHPSSGARTTVIVSSGTGQPGLLPSALVVELLQLKNESGWQ